MNEPDIIPGVGSLNSMVQVMGGMSGEARENTKSEEEGGQGVTRTAV